jgi:hypothetical protein
MAISSVKIYKKGAVGSNGEFRISICVRQYICTNRI